MPDRRLIVSCRAAFAIACVAVVTPLAAGQTQAGQAEQIGAEEVLARMAATYATCSAYRDSGLVTTVYSRQGGSDEKPFSTAFVRPDRFRFEFAARAGGRGEWIPYIVHVDPSGVRTWWGIRPGVEHPESISMAVAGATGVSSGSAHTIPELLMREAVGGWSLADLGDPQRLADDEIDGRRVIQIEGTTRGGEPLTLWIDPSTYLVLRLRYSLGTGAETTTTYEPEINIEIDPALLEFGRE